MLTEWAFSRFETNLRLTSKYLLPLKSRSTIVDKKKVAFRLDSICIREVD